MLLHFLSWSFLPRIYLWTLCKLSFTILITIKRARAGEQHSLPMGYGDMGWAALPAHFFQFIVALDKGHCNGVMKPYALREQPGMGEVKALGSILVQWTNEIYYSVLLEFLLNTTFYICGKYLIYDTTFSLNKTSWYSFQWWNTGEYVRLSAMGRISLNGHWGCR